MPVAILRLLLVVLSAFLPVPAAAQTPSVKTVFEKYQSDRHLRLGLQQAGD
jgi:hypothetical protein